MSVGGIIHNEGLVYLHPNERVLTAQQAQEWEAWQANARVSTNTNERVSTNERVNNEPNERVKTVFKGLDRVPDHLSQVKGKGRVKHIDSCIDCNDDYIVGNYNQIRCPECSERTRAKFVKDAVKRNG